MKKGEDMTKQTETLPSVFNAWKAGPLLVLGMMAIAIGAAATSRVNGPASVAGADARPVVQRTLNFIDEPDGGVGVRDAKTGEMIASLAPGSNNFLRATMRGFARQRMREEAGAETPFELTAWSDGRLSLLDPVTTRSVGLEAFGESNMVVFARLLGPVAPVKATP